MALFGLWPQPVPLAAAGRIYLLDQLRLRDLAVLEPACAGGPVSLWQALAAARAFDDDDERGRALGDLLIRAGALPGFGDAALREALAGPIGRWEVLRASLRTYQPEMDTEAMLALALALGPDQWELVEAVAWAADP